MWPDDDARDAMDALPFDAELDALDRELATAGAKARRALDRGRASQPGRAFSADLRGRLVASYESADAVTSPILPAGPVIQPATLLAPQVRRRTPTVLPTPRWSFLAVAAALIVAVVGLNGRGPLGTTLTRAGESVGASLTRDGATSALAGGVELRVGDTVSVTPDGHATLELGDGRVRLAGGSSLRLDALGPERIELAQLTGRAWHRVALPAGATYAVETAGITWTATGTAFDLDLAPDGSVLRALAIEHAIGATGPGLSLTLDEGRLAVIGLGAGSPTVATAVAGLDDLADPWLVANAQADDRLGFAVGVMADVLVAVASPTPPPSLEPTLAPSVEPSLGPDASASLEPAPTPSVTPSPTPKPTVKPTPTPAPTLGTLSLTAKACPGGVVLDWSAWGGGAFNHYTTLRSASAEIPLAYPPQAGAMDFGTSYLTDPAKTDAFDATLEAGALAWYRTMAFDAEDRVIAASGAMSVTGRAVTDLGELVIESPAAGSLSFSWTPFGGGATCFSFYKLVKSADDATPSYLEGADTVAAISEQGASAYAAEGWTPGSTYWFRLQAIRATSAGKFVVAETAPIQYTVP